MGTNICILRHVKCTRAIASKERSTNGIVINELCGGKINVKIYYESDCNLDYPGQITVVGTEVRGCACAQPA